MSELITNLIGKVVSKYTPLTDEEIVEGLQEALKIGTNQAVHDASQEDGYYENNNIKLLLPKEVHDVQRVIHTASIKYKGKEIIKLRDVYGMYMSKHDDCDDLFDDLTKAMNKGAEQAATKAGPIFLGDLQSMTIRDGLGILQGGTKAGTAYFSRESKGALVAAFQPEVAECLNLTRAQELYNRLRGFLNYEYVYNVPLVNKEVGIGVQDFVNVNLPESLDGYATEKAVDGLFFLCGEAEHKIRETPYEWRSNIIAKVFGSREAKGVDVQLEEVDGHEWIADPDFIWPVHVGFRPRMILREIDTGNIVRRVEGG